MARMSKKEELRYLIVMTVYLFVASVITSLLSIFNVFQGKMHEVVSYLSIAFYALGLLNIVLIYLTNKKRPD